MKRRLFLMLWALGIPGIRNPLDGCRLWDNS